MMLLPRACCLSRHFAHNQKHLIQTVLKLNAERGYVYGVAPCVLRAIATNSRSSAGGTEIVYRGYLTNRLKAVKVFSLTTSLTGIAAQPIIYEHASKFVGTPVMVLMCGFVGFFTFVTPILLHLITKNYVTKISYEPSTREYTATTITMFLTRRETTFKASDVKVPDVPGMFTSFMVGEVPLFVEPTMFTDPEHYVKMMGYDKPIDFRLESDRTSTKSTQPISKR